MGTKKIRTKYFGETEIESSDILTFPSGLPGFSDELAFVILNLSGNNAFHILQSVVTPDLAFMITDPHQFYADYEFELDDNIAAQLDIKDKSDLAVAVIVTLKDPFEESTLNLKAPLVLNMKAHKGKQYILQDDTRSVKAPLKSPQVPETKGD